MKRANILEQNRRCQVIFFPRLPEYSLRTNKETRRHGGRLSDCTVPDAYSSSYKLYQYFFKETFIYVFSFSFQLPPSFISIFDRNLGAHRVCWNSGTALNSYLKVLGSNLGRHSDYNVSFGDFLQAVQAIRINIQIRSPSQSPRVLRQEMSSPARTLS